PIPDAEIWTCRGHIERLARGVARTDRDGRFRIAVAPDSIIGARAAGYASVGVSVGGPSAPPMLEVVLAMTEPGARLVGTVLDERGEPVPDATIQIGHPGDTRVVPGASTPRVIARPFRCVADALGRFVCDGLVAGDAVVMARGPGSGTSVQAVMLSPASETAVTVRLSRAASVAGRVHRADGTPVRGASVTCGTADNLSACATATDADGRFVLAGLTPGSNRIVVTDHAGGFAFQQVDCAPGEQLAWDPEFRADALLLQGRVLNRTGQPFARGWVAHLTRVAATVHRLDEAGRFAVPVHERVAALPSTLEVFDHDPRDRTGDIDGVPLAWAAGLVTGTRDIELRLPDAAPRSVSMTGRIVGFDGATGDAGAWLGVQVGERWFRQRLDPLGADGRFHAGPLPAGDYYLTVRGGGNWRFGAFPVTAGEHRDLGVMTLQAGAGGAAVQRVVHLACAWPGAPASSEDVFLEFRDDQGVLIATKHIPPGPDGLSDSYALLPDGAYRAEATTRSGLAATAVFEVAEGLPRRAVLFALVP
ncbi:MAG: carboxypeptidase regulatory-like domain-containing protein, partial [Planctomycetes bacterium]|nr:carboxypeptidase regulatory-like domain-containing protein [Planctomycetota bacterium]